MLVVDDDALFVVAVTALLEQNGIEVVGQAADGLAAVRRAEELPLDVVTMDIDMPRLDGVETTRILRALPGATDRAALGN